MCMRRPKIPTPEPAVRAAEEPDPSIAAAAERERRRRRIARGTRATLMGDPLGTTRGLPVATKMLLGQ